MYQPIADNGIQIHIRSTRDGFVVEVPESGDIQGIVEQIRQAVELNAEIVRQAEVIVDFCDRPPDGLEARQIEQTLASVGVSVRRVTASRPGLRPKPRPIPIQSSTVITRLNRRPDQGANQERVARYVRGNVRAGEVRTTDSDLIILGNVEADASIHAGGDVIVWGSLLGNVQAGANPATNDATVCALHFQPTRIQIGRKVATPSNEDIFDTSTPQEAYRDGNSIFVKPWQIVEDGS